ncbi:MAG: hypothetical protein NXY59_01340 [Aigarchaeota archaeon]|nr:hypothetical protein [Candidatus Pelearchaeum maunauluense]
MSGERAYGSDRNKRTNHKTRLLKRFSLNRRLSELYPITLLYLTSLGASGIPLKTALRILGREKLLTPVSYLFAKIQVMVEKWGYLQTAALRAAASDNIDQNHRELLNRLSHAAQAGVGLGDFTLIEFQKFLASPEAEFEKMVEKLKRLAESYSALLSSMGFLSVAFLLMAIIYGSQYSSTVLNISILAVIATLASMTLLFLRNNIRRRLMHKEPHRPEKLHRLEQLSRIIIVSSMAVLIILPLTLPAPSDAGLLMRSLIPGPLSMLIASAPLLMHGIAGRRWVRLVMEREAYMPMFSRA